MAAWVEFELLNLRDGDDAIEDEIAQMCDGFGVVLVGIFNEQSKMLVANVMLSVLYELLQFLLIEEGDHLCSVSSFKVLSLNILDVFEEGLSFCGGVGGM